MIRRFVCLLLVLLLLANQGLPLAHSHHGTDDASPVGHVSRQHIHWGGHGHDNGAHADEHAAHSHEHHSNSGHGSSNSYMTLSSAIVSVGDHDADAMYFAETVTLARGGNTPSVLPAKYIAIAATHRVVNPGDELLRLGPLRRRVSVVDAACPIYLRTLSLRI